LQLSNSLDDWQQSVGIALSGGGARAMAFHLGCLRTLDQLGVLENASVMSTVSGGSVIGGMYMVRAGDFSAFEADVRATLQKGLLRPALWTAFTTTEGVKALSCLTLLLVTWGWLVPFRLISSLFAMLFSAAASANNGAAPNKWMPIRFASRTTILRRTMDKLLFEGKLLGSLRADGPRWVAIATELRTGSAYYFGRREAGSYRIGKVDPAIIPVAHAVAASAAYPLLLPAIDEAPTFQKRDGSLASQRITLTDGGIYDNLGLAPLWPDRDPKVSIGVGKVNVIVACRAGYGLRTVEPSIFVKARMTASFSTVHARAQNATMQRLFDLKKAGELRNFVLPYLDQNDDELKYPPIDLVRRAAVSAYPTNFNAMSAEWIEKLSKRGEQLTLAVIREHAPELLPPDWEQRTVATISRPIQARTNTEVGAC
jgi:NTE family protein